MENIKTVAVIPPGCELMTNEDWSKTQALILNKEITKIIHPESKDAVVLKPTEEIVLACPGSRLVIKPKTEVVASCTRGTEVEVDHKEHEFKAMTCKKLPVTSTRVVGKCLGNGKKVEVGFKVEKHFIKLLEICFDDTDLSTVYSQHVATPSHAATQHISRPAFKDGGFYHGIKVQKLYTRKIQRKTIAKILRSTELANKYIKDDNLHFLARGHLSPKADFIYGAEQMGTFYYINVAPQWQVINAGNWAALERNVRDHIDDSGIEASIFTLVHGVAELPDVDGNLKELYIYDEQNYEDNGEDDDDSEEEDINDASDDEDSTEGDNDDDINNSDNDESGDEDNDEVYYSEDDENDEISNESINAKKKNLIPVPKFYIKIVYHEDSKKGVAFITVNNPYVEKLTSDYKLCKDVCHQYPWLTWKAKEIKLGYSYCCSYEDLKKNVKNLPPLPIEHLL